MKVISPLSAKLNAVFTVICMILYLLIHTTLFANDSYPLGGSSYFASSYEDSLLISLLTKRIAEIKERAANPALPRSERQRLQRELDFLTNKLSDIMTRDIKPEKSPGQLQGPSEGP